MPEGRFVIESSRFIWGEDTTYPTRSAAMKVIREHVRDYVRPMYKQVYRLYRDEDGVDGYAWVYWDASKPAKLYVVDTEEEDGTN